MHAPQQHQPAMPNTPPLQAVIFDVDGTLAETELTGHRVAFNQTFAEFGLDWDWTPALYGELLAVTGGKERVALYIQRYSPKLPVQTDLDGWIARLHRRKSEVYSQLVMTGGIPLRPGVARLISELKASGIGLAVATTTTPSSLNCLTLANFGCKMGSLFEVIGAGDSVVNKKPAPDVYQWVLEQLKLPAQACLAIEDSFPGLSAARAAGLPTLITVNGYTANDDFCGALSVLSDLGEPDAPARHIAGQPLAGCCVDLTQLRAWQQALTTVALP